MKSRFLHHPTCSPRSCAQHLPARSAFSLHSILRVSHSDPDNIRERNLHIQKYGLHRVVQILRSALDDRNRDSASIREEQSGLGVKSQIRGLPCLPDRQVRNARKTRMLSQCAFIFFFLLIPTLTHAQTATAPSGSGTEGDPYLIAILDNLYWLSQNDAAWGFTFQQTDDIDASSTSAWDDGDGGDAEGFSPIGNSTNRFTGSYDGSGYTITGLFINRGSTDYAGLFGYTHSATLTNIGLEEVDITGNVYTGGLTGAAFSGSSVTGSYTTGTVSGNSNVGGLAGRIVSNGSISGNYSHASVTSSGDFYAGGLVGYFAGTITDCFATGDVSGDFYVGGAIGYFSGGSGKSIERVYATGQVEGALSGGLVGNSSNGTVTDSYATGDVNGSSHSGGLIGFNENTGVSNSYSAGSVTGSSHVGGFMGQNIGGTVTGGYWNTETSGQTDDIGTDNNSQTVTGLSSAEMQLQSSFAEFDFSSTWGIITGLTEPWLQAFPPDSVNGFAIEDLEAPTGSGASGDPYLVSTLNNLRWLSAASSQWEAHFQQTADIDASETSGWDSGSGFSPIGNGTTQFRGSYDGNNHTITGLFINRGGSDRVGLFGMVVAATLINIGLAEVNITGDDLVGGLAGVMYDNSTATGNYTTGNILGNSYVGGLAGQINSGTSTPTISANYSSASVTASGSNAGGLIGTVNGIIITGSYATGKVSGAGSTGGLVGYSTKEITASYASGDVTGTGEYVGGLAGEFYGSGLENTYATGNVIGNSYVGGLTGTLYSSLTNSYATGSVSGSSGVGALIGLNEGTVIGGYWNTETSGLETGIGTDNNSQTVTGLTTAEMIDSTTFSGWDFTSDTVWAIDHGFTFPYLPGTSNSRMVVATLNGDEGWRMIGNAGDVTYSDLLAPIWTQGFEGSDAGTGSSSNVYFYEESTQSWTAPSSGDDYFGTNSSEENAALNGILLYVYADDDNDGSDDSWPKYLIAENSNLNASFEVSLSYTDNVSDDSTGWNLVSNPYPVSLDWGEVVTNNENQNTLPVAYVWDPSVYEGNGAYKIHYGYPLPPGIPSDVFFDGNIPAGQSFWVKATASEASLGFKPAYQAGSETLYKTLPANKPDGELNDKQGGEPVEPSWLNLQVQHEGFSDQLTFFAGTKEGKEINVPKLNTIASRYIEFAISDKETVWITRSLPEVEHGTEYSFPLELSTTETGPFTINWTGLENFGNDWAFTLADNITGANVFLEAGGTYTFEVSNQNDKSGKPRFTLSVVAGTSVAIEPGIDFPKTFDLNQNYPNPFNPSTIISYQLPENSKVELLVFDMLGRKVATLVNEQVEAGAHQVTFDAHNLASGMYIYRLQAGNQIFTKKLTLIK